MPRCSSSAAASVGNLLTELSEQRERFLREGTLADVFAVTYFHTTRLIQEVSEAGKFRYPGVVASQQQRFYVAYTQRRSLPHWQLYLAHSGGRTLRQGTDPGNLLYGLLQHGMVAHIQGDLPRALHESRPPELSWPTLAQDFFACDPLFDRALHASLEDFGRATRRYCGPLRTTHREVMEIGSWLLCRFGGGTVRLRHLRHAAWEKATSVTFSP